ncbi:uncharacterized protein LOC127080393 [Lathyrus oleraceus]|uniref:uncharacterized protein LOC127080393 n=1 Tax=Pisum sativum TaxID=3888 RepID=UPI0021CEB96A|nr:uncharacterized protein LOC127080393 [Pisum sativum]
MENIPFNFGFPINQAEDDDEEHCELSAELTRILEHEQKETRPYQEPVDVINLVSEEVRKEVKIGASLEESVHTELVKLLQEYLDIFVWSYQDMPDLDTNIIEHHLPLKPAKGRPLIIYLTVLDESMGCVLGQHEDTGRKEHVIYYLSKKFTECKTRYSLLEKTCCALAWVARRLRQYMYVTQKVIKGSVISDYLAYQPVEGYQLMRFDFPDEDILFIRDYEIPGPDEGSGPGSRWKLVFDGASNAQGHGIGEIITSPTGFHLRFTTRLCFYCTNNMAEYEACIFGIESSIDLRIKSSRCTRIQLWEENQLADIFATLASIFKVKWKNEVPSIQIEHLDESAYCLVTEAESDDQAWLCDIKRYIEKQEYFENVSIPNKKALRKLLCQVLLEWGRVVQKEL